jgi:hypothetical protein
VGKLRSKVLWLQNEVRGHLNVEKHLDDGANNGRILMCDPGAAHWSVTVVILKSKVPKNCLMMYNILFVDVMKVHVVASQTQCPHSSQHTHHPDHDVERN